MNERPPTASPLRLFIAIPLPEPLKAELRTLQSELLAALPRNTVRWTLPEQIHLTLKFLGDTPADRIAELTSNLNQACARFSPFQLRVQSLGIFPERGLPRVIWTAVRDVEGRLSQIQAAIAESSGGFGDSRDDKAFTAHLTLGRFSKLPRSHADLPRQLGREMAGRLFGDWTVSAVDLMRSELSADGAHHFRVAEFVLGQANA